VSTVTGDRGLGGGNAHTVPNAARPSGEEAGALEAHGEEAGGLEAGPEEAFTGRGTGHTASSGGASADPANASPPLPKVPAPATGATLAPAAHAAQSASAAGEAVGSPQEGVRRPTAQQDIHSTGGTGAHDKLWIPNAAQAPAGADAGDAGGAGGYVSTQATPGAGQSEGGPQGELLDAGVDLQQAIESLHGTIQLAARQGLTQARISLQPEELGEIRIHLTQTAQGLLARVTAESPTAAQALAAAHAELRQTLSSLGIDLARLSVGRHGHSATPGGSANPEGRSDRNAAARDEASPSGRAGRATAAEATTESGTDPLTEAPVPLASPPLPGTLIDVLA
jgi:flagellar hook-length control protein FliK